VDMPRRRIVGFRAAVVPTDTTAKQVIEVRLKSGMARHHYGFRRLPFALWRAHRIEAGRGFRNANHLKIVGRPISLG
jgi:hypothetical protein